MWFINDSKEIVTSDDLTPGLHSLHRKRKQQTRYFLGCINRCFFGTTKIYPSINITDSNLLDGKVDKSGRFSFMFNGKDIETGEEIKNRYFANKNEIFVYYNKKFIDPKFLNDKEDFLCLIRLVTWNANNGKEIIYPEIIYPVFITQEEYNNTDYYDYPVYFNEDNTLTNYNLKDKIKKLESVVPYYDKQPKIRWTK